MSKVDEVKAYNSELKETLTELFQAVPKGQQKKIIREHPKVKAMLDRFHIPNE